MIETLPDGREHEIFKITARNALDDTREIVVPPDRVFVTRRQPRQFRGQPGACR